MSNAANEEEEELTEVSKWAVQQDEIEKRDELGQPVCLVAHMFTCPFQPKTHRVGPGWAKPGFFYKRKKKLKVLEKDIKCGSGLADLSRWAKIT